VQHLPCTHATRHSMCTQEGCWWECATRLTRGSAQGVVRMRVRVQEGWRGQAVDPSQGAGWGGQGPRVGPHLSRSRQLVHPRCCRCFPPRR
jgi:hypothetical protein